jgi:catechol 2,3-dioxygenase-like lactoylglutathione lyase family enzyme
MLRVIAIAGLLASCASPKAEPASPTTTATTNAFGAARGAFFALTVADVEAGAAWYADKLGLGVIMRMPKATGQPGVAILEGGGLTVELIQLDDAAPSGRDATLVHGFFKAGLTVDDLDAALAALKARGVDPFLGPFPAQDKVPANAIIKDNAGNLIQLFQRL